MFILALSTPVPFSHPGFCRLAKFWSEKESVHHSNVQNRSRNFIRYRSKSITSLFMASSFALTVRAIFPTSSISFSIRFLIAENVVLELVGCQTTNTILLNNM